MSQFPSSCLIHPYALIHPSAEIGEGNFIGPYCLIGPNVKLGNGNRLEAFVTLGTNAEHRDYMRGEPGKVLIGDHNIFREYVTVNSGTKHATHILNDCTFLRGSHVGHDAIVKSKANVSCNVMIGGHSIIGQCANLGLAAVIHQNRVIGAMAMVGMNSTVTKSIPPFAKAMGSPCKVMGVNKIGMQRNSIQDKTIDEVEAILPYLKGDMEFGDFAASEFIMHFMIGFEEDKEKLGGV